MLTNGKEQSEYFEAKFGRPTVRMKPPVDLQRFPLSRQRDLEQPVIACASALEDRRKGGRVLMRAFNLVKKHVPTARLVVASGLREDLRHELLQLVDPDWRSSVEFLGNGALTDLPKLFGSASSVVVSSLWENFSLVLLEALATGTPVVATRPANGDHDVVNAENGRLFDPGPLDVAEPSNAEGLAQALVETIHMSRRAEQPELCRRSVEPLGWTALGPSYEQLYRDLLRKGRL